MSTVEFKPDFKMECQTVFIYKFFNLFLRPSGHVLFSTVCIVSLLSYCCISFAYNFSPYLYLSISKELDLGDLEAFENFLAQSSFVTIRKKYMNECVFTTVRQNGT